MFDPALIPLKEPLFLNSERLISQMHDEEIDALRLINSDGARSLNPVPRFEECMERFGRRCIFNVDKFWEDIPRISEAIHRHGMEERVIVKEETVSNE